jgi:hypothetical protein
LQLSNIARASLIICCGRNGFNPFEKVRGRSLHLSRWSPGRQRPLRPLKPTSSWTLSLSSPNITEVPPPRSRGTNHPPHHLPVPEVEPEGSGITLLCSLVPRVRGGVLVGAGAPRSKAGGVWGGASPKLQGEKQYVYIYIYMSMCGFFVAEGQVRIVARDFTLRRSALLRVAEG